MRLKTNRKPLLLCTLLPLFLTLSCQSEKQEEKENIQSFVDLSRVPDDQIYFQCTDITQDQDETPHHEVFIVVAENKTKIGEIEVCNTLAKEQYAQHQIPSDAIQAIGGLTQDTYTFIYAIRDHEDKLLVRKGSYTLNQQDSSYNYRTLLSFSSNELSANPEVNPAQLAGVYGLNEGDRSWLLFISMSQQTLTAQLIELNRPLPDFHQIADALKEGGAIPELLRGFRLNTHNLKFSSDNGNGKFIIPENGPLTVVFEDRQDSQNKPLTLKRMQ